MKKTVFNEYCHILNGTCLTGCNCGYTVAISKTCKYCIYNGGLYWWNKYQKHTENNQNVIR